MSYKVALNFEDGVTRIIDCDAGELITDAAFRQRINVPMDCRDGVCGTCKCLCERGDYELGFYLEEAMTEDEAAERYVLTCQMTVNSDCVIRIPASSMACKTGAETVKAEVVAIEQLSETSFNFRIKPDKKVAFLPGQYVNVSIPGSEQTRSYSFSSHPGSDEGSFLIRNIPGGLMSSYLGGRARPGDRVDVTGPMGAFYLRPIERPLLFLAGGTGLAPFLAMLELMADQEVAHPVKLYYAVTRDGDLVEVDRIQALGARIPTLTFETIVADEASAHAKKGFVTQHLTAEDLNGGDIDVYLCGPPPMVEAVRAHLKQLGIKPHSFHFEKFNPAGLVEAAA